MKKRIFIVAPNGQNPEDKRHDICRTSSQGSFLDIYGSDTYEVLEERQSLKAAVRVAKRMGAKRPTVI